MKYTKNQLAQLACWYIVGRDGKYNDDENRAIRSALNESNEFFFSDEDWEFSVHVINKGCDWDEVFNLISDRPQLERYKLIQLLANVVRQVHGQNTRPVDGWPAIFELCRNIGVIYEDWREWVKNN